MDKIVIFDAYGTLFRLDVQNEQLNRLLRDKKDDFLELWRNKLLEYSWLISLAGEWEEFNSILRKALSYSCEVLEISENEISPLLMEIYENPVMFEDASALLKYQNFTACIMSNGELVTLKRAVKNLSIDQRINQIFSASAVRHFKVSTQVYRMATTYFNTGPGKMLFVSSNPWDIAGASLFGYETVWVNREDQVFDKLVEGPDHEVKDLKEVLNLL